MKLPDALRDALGQIVANERREWRRERELIEAQAGQTIAELRATIAELQQEVREAVASRLATVRDGVDGAPGRDGVDGKDGRDGVDGRDGEPGAPGRDGVDGKDGAAGRDADPIDDDRIAKVLGRYMAEHPPDAGRDGVDGKDGRDGVDGKDGAPGRDGVDGRDADPISADQIADAVTRHIDANPPPAGRDGVDGKDGRDGADGTPGRDGVEGPPGKDGRDGEPGREGPPGKLPLVREWSDGVHYEADVVTHAGAVYQAQRDTGREPPHDDWLLIAAPGRDGEDGRSMTIRGTWSAADTYFRLDVVALNGASFAARRDDPGPCPGEGWQMIAAQGKRGNPGEPGKALRGEPGKAGPPVAAMSVDDDGMLTLVNADGSEVRCDLYPILSKLGR